MRLLGARGSQTRGYPWLVRIWLSVIGPFRTRSVTFLGLLADVFHILLFHGLSQPSALKADGPPRSSKQCHTLAQNRDDPWGFWTGRLAKLLSPRVTEKLSQKLRWALRPRPSDTGQACNTSEEVVLSTVEKYYASLSVSDFHTDTRL